MIITCCSYNYGLLNFSMVMPFSPNSTEDGLFQWMAVSWPPVMDRGYDPWGPTVDDHETISNYSKHAGDSDSNSHSSGAILSVAQQLHSHPLPQQFIREVHRLPNKINFQVLLKTCHLAAGNPILFRNHHLECTTDGYCESAMNLSLDHGCNLNWW